MKLEHLLKNALYMYTLAKAMFTQSQAILDS